MSKWVLNSGVEIEFKNLPLQKLHDVLSKKYPSMCPIKMDRNRKNDGSSWRIAYDNSVSVDPMNSGHNTGNIGRYHGGEISTPVFHSTDQKFINRLERILHIIRDLGGVFDNETGLHLHFEIPNNIDIFRIIVAWLKHEDTIYHHFIPKSRWNYYYVTPINNRITERYLVQTTLSKVNKLLLNNQLTHSKLFDHYSVFNFRYTKSGEKIMEIRGAPVFANIEKNIEWFAFMTDIMADCIHNPLSMIRYFNG